jgi:hypothetical protein
MSVALFDGKGRLQGTARTDVKVPRIWLGRVVMMAETLTLDFGRSLDYVDAQTFAASIGRQKVQTPEDWQANNK